MDLQRRDFLRQLSCILPSLTALSSVTAAEPKQTPSPKTGHDMSGMPASWMGKEEILLLVYPQFTALDLFGPQYFLSSLMGAKVRLVAKTHEPVSCDTGVKVVPDLTFEDAPKSPDMILIPGGTLGTLTAMQDPETIAFVKAVGANARFVSSVCTGSLVLGAAGFLRGKKATSHWVVRDMLRHFGAVPTAERVVADGNVLTAAGVTAGLDLGMYVSSKWRDQEYTDCLGLLAEYAPSSDPRDVSAKAPPLARQRIEEMFVGFKSKVESACTGK